MTKFLSIVFIILINLLLSCSAGQKDSTETVLINFSDFDATADIREGDIHLIAYGLTFPIPGLDSLTRVYGFYYQDRGCVINHDTIPALTDAYNKQVIEYLSKRNGQGWFKKFNAIADSMGDVALKSNGQQ